MYYFGPELMLNSIEGVKLTERIVGWVADRKRPSKVVIIRNIKEKNIRNSWPVKWPTH